MKEWFKCLKTITKLSITTGYCRKCDKRVAAKPLPKSTVSLGDNIRQFITFSNIVLQLRYEQTKDLLAGTMRFKVSDGEIVNILYKQSNDLSQEFERIKANIRAGPSTHFDETGWNLLQEDEMGKYGRYAWIMTSTRNKDVIFHLARNRGKGNINDLIGDNYDGIGISDDYGALTGLLFVFNRFALEQTGSLDKQGAYKNAFKKGKQALCWAHPHRKLRDLKNSDSLSEDKRKHCKKEYEKFAALYGKVRDICTQPFRKKERLKEKEKLTPMFLKMAKPRKKDPEKLVQIKKRLLERRECYFTCITEP